jgi:hypothetical protein
MSGHSPTGFAVLMERRSIFNGLSFQIHIAKYRTLAELLICVGTLGQPHSTDRIEIAAPW